MQLFNTHKQYIFTIVFGLLLNLAWAGKPKTVYYVGVWDGNSVQINNPQQVGKSKFCVKIVYVNGRKVKTDYKSGGLEFNPADYGFTQGEELLIQIDSQKDCEPTFHSKGFNLQRD